MSDRFWLALWTLVIGVLVVLMCLLYEHCEQQNERESKCLEQHTPESCYRAFGTGPS